MKKRRNDSIRWIIATFVFQILLISCQKEEKELVDLSEDAIDRESVLAKTMEKVVISDGSFDNVVDKSDCYSINIPYRILHNGQERMIMKQEDYSSIHSTDDVQILFPIKITFHDYAERQVSSKTELESFSLTCNTVVDDIECIDFVYPIKISLFNTVTNKFSTTEVGHDKQLFQLMTNLDQNNKIAIRYPIALRQFNGINVGAGHNKELLERILKVATSCN